MAGASVSTTKGSKKKSLDFDINLVPFIDLLSVCISFLLMTAIRFEIGSMDVKQAVGGQSQAETKKVPAVWAKMQDSGVIELELQDAPPSVSKQLGRIKIAAKEGKADFEVLKTSLNTLRDAMPDLSTALVMPTENTKYEDVIDIMDNLKAGGLTSLGVSPL